ncbi:MAG: DUF983 domain-containing protein [Actinomycetia bacterium]|nr:DUF983 domain-containing protein [Actinomycetes bacterium]
MSNDAPKPGRLMSRGLRMRCPVCGGGKIFRRWFKMVDDCPRCEFHFERIDGHWMGSLGLNTIISFTLLAVTLVCGFILTYPDFPVMTLFAIGMVIAIGFPVLFFPVSRTLWTAIDIWMRPLHDHELAALERFRKIDETGC